MKTKSIKTISAFAILIFSFFQVSAQLQLPQPSPKASVMQTVGLTDITIDYSSPGVKGRTIWGEVVPFDAIWRAGANAATKITFSRDVTINGTNVSKGSYSVFVIPSKTADWIVVLNKNATASTGEYKKEEDLLRLNVKPQTVPMRERLAYSFSDFNDAVATINLEWEKVRVSLNVNVDTEKQTLESINSTLGGTWRQYANAARYMLENKKDYETGMKYIAQSLQLKEDWFNQWIKAELLAAKNNFKEAHEIAQKAKELGDKNPDGFFYKKEVEKAIKEWSEKK